MPDKAEIGILIRTRNRISLRPVRVCLGQRAQPFALVLVVVSVTLALVVGTCECVCIVRAGSCVCVNACRAPWAPGRHLDTVQSSPGYSRSALSGSAVCYPIHAAVCCIYVCVPGCECVSVWRRALTHTHSIDSTQLMRLCVYMCL